jgi:hypothetical protein
LWIANIFFRLLFHNRSPSTIFKMRNRLLNIMTKQMCANDFKPFEIGICNLLDFKPSLKILWIFWVMVVIPDVRCDNNPPLQLTPWCLYKFKDIFWGSNDEIVVVVHVTQQLGFLGRWVGFLKNRVFYFSKFKPRNPAMDYGIFIFICNIWFISEFHWIIDKSDSFSNSFIDTFLSLPFIPSSNLNNIGNVIIFYIQSTCFKSSFGTIYYFLQRSLFVIYCQDPFLVHWLIQRADFL